MRLKEAISISLLGLGLAFAPEAGAAGRTLTVTTTNNENPPAGSMSLFQAITSVADGDTIAFNIPGDGPHVIVTPVGGYPIITANNVTIDGYSQPGSAPNSNPILGGNNAKIRIVLDSSDAASGPSKDTANPLLLERRSTRLPFSGYGDTENGIIAVMRGDNFTIRGISFLARRTVPSTGEQGDEDAGDVSVKDPGIYAVALIEEAKNAKVQGCWFGLHPDGTTVKPVKSAVAAFRHRVPTDTYSGGLVFGTDGDGANDVAEFNISIGAIIAVAIELPNARISGNYFNVFPNGTSFYDMETASAELLAAGFSSGTLESIENGRLTENTVIGTNGDGISDANERNIFAHSIYDVDIEFYSNAQNAVIAGNYFGVGADGTTVQPELVSGAPNLISLPGTASVRIGSNGDGVSDDIEGNFVHSIRGTVFVQAGGGVPIVARGNKFIGNAFEGFVFAEGQNGRGYETYYAPVLANAAAGAIPNIASITDGIMSGTVPAPNTTDYPHHFIDVYTVDPVAADRGVILPGTRVATFKEGSAQDSDPAPNAFKYSLIGSTVQPGSKVVIAVTYSKAATNTTGTNALTGPLSNAVEANIPAFLPGSIESVGLSRIVPDKLVIPVTENALGNWEPNASVVGNTHFLVEGNTFAEGTTDSQRFVVAVQPVTGGASKTVEGFHTDAGAPFKGRINLSRQNGNPGRVAGDKRPGAVNYIVGAEISAHGVPEFQSDTRWAVNGVYSGDNRWAGVQTYALNPATLDPAPLTDAFDAVLGKNTGTFAGNTPEVSRFGGDVAALDNGNFVVVIDDRSSLIAPRRTATAAIVMPNGQIVKEGFAIDEAVESQIWANVAAHKGGFVARFAANLYFFDNAGNLQGKVAQSTSGIAFDTGRGDGTRLASHINSHYVYLAGRVAAENVVKVAAWDARTRAFVAAADVSEGAFTGGFDRANLAVDALNRVCVSWVSQPAGFTAQQVAARVLAFNGTAFTALTKSFLPFVNSLAVPDGVRPVRSIGMSVAMTTKQILVAAKGEINLNNQPAQGADSPTEANFYTVFTHPDPKEDPTPGAGGESDIEVVISKAGPNSLRLDWEGGSGPFLVQHKDSLAEPQWLNLLTTTARTAVVPNGRPHGFFRIVGGVTNTVIPLSVVLNGAGENPGVTTTGIGRGVMSLEGNKLMFDLRYSGLSGTASAAHIHGPGTTDQNVGVLVNLAPYNGGAFGAAGRLAGTVDLTEAQKTALLSGDTYVNIHTAASGGGEIRGQISPANLKATLSGAAEVPAVDTTATGTGAFTLVGDELFVDVSYSGLKGAISNAHIHGPAAATGSAGVLVGMMNLHTGAASSTAASFKGSVVLTPAALRAIVDGMSYFNIHSGFAGGGEIRGQIVP